MATTRCFSNGLTIGSTWRSKILFSYENMLIKIMLGFFIRVVEDINNVLGGILYLSISNCVVAITLLSYVISLVRLVVSCKFKVIIGNFYLNLLTPQKVPEQTIPRYAIIIAAFLIETLVFCLVGQGIIREVWAYKLSRILLLSSSHTRD